MGEFIGPALSIAGPIIGGLIGGNSAPSGPSVYQPGGTPTVDANLQNLLSQNTSLLSGGNNPYNVLSPQILQAFQQLYSTPGQGGYQGAANTAGAAYTGVGANSLNLSQLLSSTAPQALQGANSVYQMGMDPQKALYDQTLQKVTDQSNVNNAQYGLTGQQAAANTNTADANFNIDWQQAELDRALKGLSGYNQGITNIGTTGAAAQNIGSAGAGSVLTGGETPYGAGQAIGGAQETALAQYLSQLLGPATSSQGTINDLAGYLGQGIGASSAGNTAAVNDYYAQLQGAAGGAVGGSALGSQLGSLFTGGSPTTVASAGLLPWQQPGYGTTWGYGSAGYGGG